MRPNQAIKDYYSILDIVTTATAAQIKAAYRALAKKWHPDINTAPEAVTRFSEIAEAYAVLSDPNLRKEYDIARQSGRPPTVPPPTGQGRPWWSATPEIRERAKAQAVRNIDLLADVVETTAATGTAVAATVNFGRAAIGAARQGKGGLALECLQGVLDGVKVAAGGAAQGVGQARGWYLASTAKTCSAGCGAAIPAGSKFCPGCGKAVA